MTCIKRFSEDFQEHLSLNLSTRPERLSRHFNFFLAELKVRRKQKMDKGGGGEEEKVFPHRTPLIKEKQKTKQKKVKKKKF